MIRGVIAGDQIDVGIIAAVPIYMMHVSAKAQVFSERAFYYQNVLIYISGVRIGTGMTGHFHHPVTTIPPTATFPTVMRLTSADTLIGRTHNWTKPTVLEGS